QTIKGWVFSAKDKTPVEYATVSILHLPDSSVVKGVSTEATGAFLIDDLKTGSYYLRVTSLGLQTKGKSVVLKPDLKTVSVDTIFMMDASKQIAEVVVTGEKIKGK